MKMHVARCTCKLRGARKGIKGPYRRGDTAKNTFATEQAERRAARTKRKRNNDARIMPDASMRTRTERDSRSPSKYARDEVKETHDRIQRLTCRTDRKLSHFRDSA